MAGIGHLRGMPSLLPDPTPADLKTLTPMAWAADFAEQAA
jgi:hypothetical protein